MNLKRCFAKCFAWLGVGLLLMHLTAFTTMQQPYFAKDGAPAGSFNANAVPNAIPKKEALSRYGNPYSYVVDGRRYYVMRNASGYDKVGYASWYGNQFHGQRTSRR